MFRSLNAWIAEQIPPVVLLVLAVLGWLGVFIITPGQRLNAAEHRISSLEERAAKSDLVLEALAKRACWDSTPEQRIWLSCGQILGNATQGGPP